MAIEKAPFMSQEELLSAMLLTPNDKVKEMVNKIMKPLSIGIPLNIRGVLTDALLSNCGHT